MRIGIDFDNTIVSYDELFYKIAVEKKLIPIGLSANKIVIREHLRRIGNEAAWTLMQGEAYGLRISEARPYPGVINFMLSAQRLGHSIYIISHKTKYPFAGPAYDLHKAAYKWIEISLEAHGINFSNQRQIFFELTKEEKISRANEIKCDVFIDDLPEILSLPGFDKKTQRLLFSPDNLHNRQNCKFEIFTSWPSLQAYLI